MARDTTWAILAAWGVLIANRRWRPARDWPERLGRILGAGWLTLRVWDLVLMGIMQG